MSAPGDEGGAGSLENALADYLDAIDAREPDARDRVLREHPRHAAALRAHFDAEDLLGAHPPPTAPGPPPAPEDDPLPPAFGDYEIVRRIGAGGMGVVYAARERSLGRLVALKVLRAGPEATEEQLARFEREARAAASLDHPGIVPVYRVGRHDGRPFLAMRLVEGGSLDRRLADYGRDPRAVAALVARIARAVAHAHERGVLHRDLKPGNVLLDEHGAPLVADFGLAAWTCDVATALTATGTILGTPGHMAPEQADSGLGPQGPAIDVWALGGLLHLLCTGRVPFRGDSPLAVVRRVAEEEPEPLARAAPGVPRDLAALCDACLRREPSRRPPSAAAVADDLERFLRGEPVLVRRTGPIERAFRAVRRRPALAGAVLAVALAVVLGLLGLRSDARRRATEARARADLHLQRARAAVDAGDVTAAALHFAQAEVEAPSLAARQGREAHRTPLPLVVAMPAEGTIWRLAFDPPGRRLAVACDTGRVRILDAASGGDVGVLEHDGAAVRGLAWTPDGSRIVTGDDLGTLSLWDVHDRRRIARGDAGGVGAPRAEALRSVIELAVLAEDQVVAIGLDGLVRLWRPSAATQEAVEVVGREGGPVELRALAVEPGGRRLWIGGATSVARPARSRGFVRSVDLASRALGPEHDVDGVAWSVRLDAHRDRLLATDDAGARAYAWVAGASRLTPTGLEPGEPRPSPPHLGAVYTVAESPDGEREATGGLEGIVRIWSASRAPPREVRRDDLGDLVAVAPGDGEGTVLVSRKGGRLDLIEPRARRAIATGSLRGEVVAVARDAAGWWVLASEGASDVRRHRVQRHGDALRALGVDSLRTTATPAKSFVAVDGTIGFRQDGTPAVVVARGDLAGGLRETASLRPTHFAVSPGGRHLATIDTSKEVRVLALPDLSERWRRAPPGIASLEAVSADGSRVALSAADYRRVELWDTRADVLVGVADHREDVRVAFASEGLAFATAGADGHVRFWSGLDAAAIGPVLAFTTRSEGRSRPDSCLAGEPFAFAGRTLVVGCESGRVVLHDASWMDPVARDDSDELLRASLVALRRVGPDGALEPFPLDAWRAARAEWRRRTGE